MELFDVKDAAKRIRRSVNVIDAAVHAADGDKRHLDSYRDPERQNGRVIFEDDLIEWVKRNYERL